MGNKPVYFCNFIGMNRAPGGKTWHMCIEILEPHKASGKPAGWVGNTSAILSMDFERGICVTLNSIYQWRVK